MLFKDAALKEPGGSEAVEEKQGLWCRFLSVPWCFVRRVGFQRSRCWGNGGQVYVRGGRLFISAANGPLLPLLYIFIVRSWNSLSFTGISDVIRLFFNW